MLVQPNPRMDGLIPVGLSVLSAHLKVAHEVRLYDTTFINTGKETGDHFRETGGQVTPVDLRSYGVERIKMSPGQLRQDFRREVLDYNPGLVGFSTLEMTHDQGVELAREIRDLSIPIIFGGIYPTFSPRIVLEEPSIDMICEGGGEEMLPELATALESGEDVRGILNLTIKQDGRIYRSGEVVELRDLPAGDDVDGEHTGLRRPPINMTTELLAPDYSIYDSKRFWKKMGGKAVRTVAMELSRGCPYSCGFCCVPMQRAQHNASLVKYGESSGLELGVLRRQHQHHREKSIGQFIEEVRSAKEEHDINFVYFTDESFLSMSRKRFDEFIAGYREVRLPFFIETRAETIRPGYAKALERVGCEGVAIGIESGSLVVRRDLLNRLTSDEDIIQAFGQFRETGIRVCANNIIGFPGETREDIMKTVEINRLVGPDNVIANAFRPYSGTRLRQVCIQRGLISQGTRVGDNRTFEAYNNGVLSGEELSGIRKVFPLYVGLQKSRWGEVRRAESEEGLYKKLIEEVGGG